MTLRDIVTRSIPPAPWTEGDNIPWDDPGFSERMLAEHLTQDHDLASRRLGLIDSHVAWLTDHVIGAKQARILDLACGPGLYLTRLADLGHSGTGIDFSPASIEHARSIAAARHLEIEYREGDLRTIEFGSGYHVALLLYGQLNVFRRSEALDIARKALVAIEPGGTFVAEPQTLEHIKNSSSVAPSWSTHDAGLFSPEPHLLLTESFWNDRTRTGIQRFHVIDAGTGAVSAHSISNEAYTVDELTGLFEEAGFVDVRLQPSLTGQDSNDGLFVVLGTRRV
jgi:SAM-dependent methyltransferase